MSEEPQNKNGVAGKPMNETANVNGNVFKTFEAATAPQIPLPKPDIQNSIKNLHKDIPLQNLRTYQSDVAEAVRNQDTSVVQLSLNEKRKEELKKVHADPKRSVFLLILSIILMVGSGMAVTVYTIINVFLKAELVVPYQEEVLFATESTQNIILESSDQILDALQRTSIQQTGTPNSLSRLKFLTATTTLGETVTPSEIIPGPKFASLVSPRLPESLIRTLDPLYSTGIQYKDTLIPYIVLKNHAYEAAFSSMLQWESSMVEDLSPYFSYLTGSTQFITSPGFEDIIIKNKDVRMLRDDNGVPILMYSFSDKDTLIITTDQDTLQEIFSRLATSQFVR